MKKVIHTLSQSHHHIGRQVLTETDKSHKNHKVTLDLQLATKPETANACPCPEVPPLASLSSQSLGPPGSPSLLCVHLEQTCVFLASPRQCPKFLVERKGHVSAMFLYPINSLII